MSWRWTMRFRLVFPRNSYGSVWPSRWRKGSSGVKLGMHVRKWPLVALVSNNFDLYKASEWNRSHKMKTKTINMKRIKKSFKIVKKLKLKNFGARKSRKNLRPEIVVDIADGVIIPIDSSLCVKWKSCVSLGSPNPIFSWQIDIWNSFMTLINFKWPQ